MLNEYSAFSQEMLSINVEQVMVSIGNPSDEHILKARSIISAIPNSVYQLLQTPKGAEQVVLAILSGEPSNKIEKIRNIVTKNYNQKFTNDVLEIAHIIKSNRDWLRLTLIDLALPRLKNLSKLCRKNFTDTANTIIASSESVSLFEYTLYAILERHLTGQPSKTIAPVYYSFKPLLHEIAFLLHFLTLAGNDRSKSSDRYFTLMQTFTNKAIDQDQLPKLSQKNLDGALRKLNLLAPILKRPLIRTLIEAVLDDNHVSLAEADLLRAVSELLSCPIPPMLDKSLTKVQSGIITDLVTPGHFKTNQTLERAFP